MPFFPSQNRTSRGAEIGRKIILKELREEKERDVCSREKIGFSSVEINKQKNMEKQERDMLEGEYELQKPILNSFQKELSYRFSRDFFWNCTYKKKSGYCHRKIVYC